MQQICLLLATPSSIISDRRDGGSDRWDRRDSHDREETAMTEETAVMEECSDRRDSRVRIDHNDRSDRRESRSGHMNLILLGYTLCLSSTKLGSKLYATPVIYQIWKQTLFLGPLLAQLP